MVECHIETGKNYTPGVITLLFYLFKILIKFYFITALSIDRRIECGEHNILERGNDIIIKFFPLNSTKICNAL